MPTDEDAPQTPVSPAPVVLESAMRSGQDNDEAEDAMTIGDKFGDETPERHDERAVAEAAEELGAPPADGE
jgi:hypothetical protein